MKISMTQQKTQCDKPIQQAQLSVNTLTSQSQKNKTCLLQFLCFFWHLTAYVHHHFYLTGVNQTAVNWNAVWSLHWLQFTDSLLLMSFTGACWPSLSLSSLQFLCWLHISCDGTFLNSLPSSWHGQNRYSLSLVIVCLFLFPPLCVLFCCFSITVLFLNSQSAWTWPLIYNSFSPFYSVFPLYSQVYFIFTSEVLSVPCILSCHSFPLPISTLFLSHV